MPARCASDKLTDLALASRSEIRIICTLLPPESRQSPVSLPKIDRILSADNELQPVLAKARQIRALGGIVNGFFPPHLARQDRVATSQEGEQVQNDPQPPGGTKNQPQSPPPVPNPPNQR